MSVMGNTHSSQSAAVFGGCAALNGRGAGEATISSGCSYQLLGIPLTSFLPSELLERQRVAGTFPSEPGAAEAGVSCCWCGMVSLEARDQLRPTGIRFREACTEECVCSRNSSASRCLPVGDASSDRSPLTL